MFAPVIYPCVKGDELRLKISLLHEIGVGDTKRLLARNAEHPWFEHPLASVIVKQ